MRPRPRAAIVSHDNEAATGHMPVALHTTHHEEVTMNRMRAGIAAKDESGFTLIELLIVIVILGILAGIAVFAVGSFQQDATNACTEANARINATQSQAALINSSASLAQQGTC